MGEETKLRGLAKGSLQAEGCGPAIRYCTSPGTGTYPKRLGAALGLALIIGSSNYVSPKATLDAIFPALLYLAFWYGQAALVFGFVAIETKARSIEEISSTLDARRRPGRKPARSPRAACGIGSATSWAVIRGTGDLPSTSNPGLPLDPKATKSLHGHVCCSLVVSRFPHCLDPAISVRAHTHAFEPVRNAVEIARAKR